MSENVDTAEIAKFERLATHWWDTQGEMAPLHVINPARLRYVERAVGDLKGLSALDVGCGGGILTESLARAGAKALGIDLADASIQVGRQHAAETGIDVEYRTIAAEDLAQERTESFDLVCCMEMLEHVPEPAQTIEACAKLVKPGGNLVFSTINRNLKSYALMIVGAEYVMRLLPRGTHDYAKFIRPSELDRWARNTGLETLDISGLRYDPLLKTASVGTDIDVNYLVHCRKLL